jgi:O-antigen ligase
MGKINRAGEIMTASRIQDKSGEYIQPIIVLTLVVLAGTIFFTDRRASVFDALPIGAFLAWRFIFRKEPQLALPNSLIAWTVLYLASCFVGALMSGDQNWQLNEFRRRYTHVFVAGLLFTAPLSIKNRKIVILSFFVAGAIAGAVGILQYFGLIYEQWPRPHGFSAHPILYAELLAFVCGSAIIMLFIDKEDLFRSPGGRFLLIVIVFSTFGGILASGSRGVWIALAVACLVTLLLYNRRKAATFILSAIAVCILALLLSSALRERASSIVTSLYTEDEKGSTGTRLELWKGSLLIFKEHPLFGVGTGNYQSSIEDFVHRKRIKEPLVAMHAHNIFFQALATRGIIGLVLTAGFFFALIKWGMREIDDYRQIGGYIIVLSGILTIIGGLTENNTEHAKYLAAFCFTIGLLGPYGEDKAQKDIKMPSELLDSGLDRTEVTGERR